MQKAKSYRNLIWGCCMTGIAMFFAFFFLYHTYIQDIIYEERLNQMEEITRQMFQNLEDVIDSHWDRVTEECNYLRDANIQTTDELCRHMKKKYELSAYADHKITLMAVDSEGGYYTESGKRGLFRDLDYFEESPEKISFVFDSMTDNQSKMVFLNRLPEPIYLQNGEKKTSILYFGIAQDMEQLNPYFNCEAYNGNNSVYVLDDNGSKLFNSNQVELIKGHNVFSVLQNMKYLHNSSFEKTKAELEEKGCSYSNAVLDGTEYFYGLKRMENAEWTLIFLVPAEYVATNTLKLVNFVMVFIVIFTVIVAVCVMLGISFVMYRNQLQAIRVERENNAKLETVNTKLRQAKQAAEDAFQVAQEANRSKSSFLANMSHDIRTPMNAIIGITSLIRHDAGDKGKVIEYADKIDTSSQHLLGIINDVLDMSKLDSGEMYFAEESVYLREMLENCRDIMETRAAEHGIELETPGLENFNPPRVLTSELHIRQIAMNIISNAIKYNKPNGKIIATAEVVNQTEDYVTCRFMVKDTGIGMSDDFQKNMFDPFSQEYGKDRSEFRGTELELSIVKRIVDQMGGEIRVESKKGVGTTFTWTLTFKTDKEYREEKVAANQQDFSLAGKKILAAEDNTLNAEILIFLLDDMGADTVLVENGKQVVEAFKESDWDEYDCILMDVMMPIMDGYTATRRIRGLSRPDAQSIPIIALTANAFAEDVQAALDAGMDDHVAKPMDMDILISAIEKCVKR